MHPLLPRFHALAYIIFLFPSFSMPRYLDLSEMGNDITRVMTERRKLGVNESPFPRRKVRVEDGIEEGSSEGSPDGYGGSSIDMEEAPTPQHQSWSEFNAANGLPSSVYLWACDEPQPGGNRPSRSDALVAWIILIVRPVVMAWYLSAE